MKTMNTISKEQDQELVYKDQINSFMDQGIIIKGIKAEKLDLPLLNSYLNKESGKEMKDKGITGNIASSEEIIRKRLSKIDLEINAGYYIEVLAGEQLRDPLFINQAINQDKPVINEKNMIFLGENSFLTIVFDYTSSENTVGIHNGITEVYIEKNAVLNIIKLQRQNDQSYSFDDNTAEVFGQGKINWFSVEIGSARSFSSYNTFLKDCASEGSLSTVFFADGKSKYDLSYTMEHNGRHSISSIDSRGVLKDYAEKIFRGKLKFNRGASKSTGSEKEDVLLLDPTVKSRVIPSLYCEEEDVSGQHAASAGKIKESQLYYLMSRGLTEAEAKKILVEAALNPLIEMIPVENIRQTVSNEIQGRLYHENNS